MNNKDLSIKKFSHKNLMAFAFCAILAISVLLYIIASQYADVLNLFISPFELDVRESLYDNSETMLEVIGEEPKEGLTFNSDGRTEDFHRYFYKQYGERLYPGESIYLYNKRYVQDYKYVFKITPNEIYEVGLGYQINSYRGNTVVNETPVSRYILCETDYYLFFAVVPYDSELKSGDSLKGSFVPFSENTWRDINEVFYEFPDSVEVFPYQLNTMQTFGGEQFSSLMMTIICFGIIGALLIVLLRCIFNPQSRPLYKQLYILLGDEKIIDEQLQAAVFVDKKYITKDWIITPKFFKTKISVNLNNKGRYEK